MAFRAFCDTCQSPIAPDDNHIAIQRIGVIDKKQLYQAQDIHVCGKGCLNKWIDKIVERPMIITPSSSGLGPAQ